MEILTRIYRDIQFVFEFLEEVLEPLTDKQKKLIQTLELIQIEKFIHNRIDGFRGRPEKDRRAIARAFIAKAIYNLPTTRILIDHLRGSPNLRRICGWERVSEVPSESLFSRVFAEFAEGHLPQKIHEALIKKYESPRLVGHISRDSTAIKAREKSSSKKKKKKKKSKYGKGRPRKGEIREPKEQTRLERQFSGMLLVDMLSELPKSCDWGSKKNSGGKKENWKGYKLHVDWADGGIPISCILTSASVYDNQVAMPLAEMTYKQVTSLYDLMDAAYDADAIKKHSYRLGHIPIIAQNPRRGLKKEMEPASEIRYHERSVAERGFGRLKDDLGALFVRVKGYAKVMAHLMFGILVLSAEQLLRLVV